MSDKQAKKRKVTTGRTFTRLLSPLVGMTLEHLLENLVNGQCEIRAYDPARRDDPIEFKSPLFQLSGKEIDTVMSGRLLPESAREAVKSVTGDIISMTSGYAVFPPRRSGRWKSRAIDEESGVLLNLEILDARWFRKHHGGQFSPDYGNAEAHCVLFGEVYPDEPVEFGAMFVPDAAAVLPSSYV